MCIPPYVPGIYHPVYTLYTPGYTPTVPRHAGVLRCTVWRYCNEALGSRLGICLGESLSGPKVLSSVRECGRLCAELLRPPGKNNGKDWIDEG